MEQAKMWEALEARRDATVDPRHRQMLDVVIEHAKAEAERSRRRAQSAESPRDGEN